MQSDPLDKDKKDTHRNGRSIAYKEFIVKKLGWHVRAARLHPRYESRHPATMKQHYALVDAVLCVSDFSPGPGVHPEEPLLWRSHPGGFSSLASTCPLASRMASCNLASSISLGGSSTRYSATLISPRSSCKSSICSRFFKPHMIIPMGGSSYGRRSYLSSQRR